MEPRARVRAIAEHAGLVAAPGAPPSLPRRRWRVLTLLAAAAVGLGSARLLGLPGHLASSVAVGADLAVLIALLAVDGRRGSHD